MSRRPNVSSPGCKVVSEGKEQSSYREDLKLPCSPGAKMSLHLQRAEAVSKLVIFASTSEKLKVAWPNGSLGTADHVQSQKLLQSGPNRSCKEVKAWVKCKPAALTYCEE